MSDQNLTRLRFRFASMLRSTQADVTWKDQTRGHGACMRVESIRFDGFVTLSEHEGYVDPLDVEEFSMRFGETRRA